MLLNSPQNFLVPHLFRSLFRCLRLTASKPVAKHTSNLVACTTVILVILGYGFIQAALLSWGIVSALSRCGS
jgi:hypothetical protein